MLANLYDLVMELICNFAYVLYTYIIFLKVKRVYTYISLFFALVIYCISINNETKSVAHTFSTHESSNESNTISRPSIALNYHGVISQPENLVEVISNTVTYDRNTGVQKYSFVQNAKQQCFSKKLKQYSKTALSSLIQFRKTDIFFPFHYFW
ncbi:hypothetical protein KO500_08160 [Cellulophaga baltica]|uniref:hypothetical protein n=1 Tax=Cellulophaga TaxID=104264 RepID=UPI001C06A776|nr:MULTISPECIES: hypothetical protein [Cellulophaga]MBU2996405.1 hypothetical protein [Cellulophaga baltica]MDO6767801.1 hypothetical protein [Cellulophaga sp. 1_MG-2023]